MATLIQIWANQRTDITKVARRTGNTDPNCYVPLGHKTLKKAIKKSLILDYIDFADLAANDWYVSD